jgi:hypothetical protein
VRERIIAANPVMETRVPKVGVPAVEMHPFSESQLAALWTAARTRNERLADILLIAGWTGLRWSELRAARVRDFVQIPMPLLGGSDGAGLDGHTSIATTNIYLHHLGTGADRAGLDRLNAREHMGHTFAPGGRVNGRRKCDRAPFLLVRNGAHVVELRGFEPLTFSDGRAHWTLRPISV